MEKICDYNELTKQAEIIEFLCSGPFSCFDINMAQKIVMTFDLETLKVIDTDTDRLKTIKGIGKKKILTLKNDWMRYKELLKISQFLENYQVAELDIGRIYSTWGNESVNMIEQNPYRLLDFTENFDFGKIDDVALKSGFSKDAIERVKYGILYIMKACLEEGDVFTYKEYLAEQAARFLEVKKKAVTESIAQMISDKDLICEGRALYLPEMYLAEISVAEKLNALLHAPAEDRLWECLTEASRKSGKEDLSVDVNPLQARLGIEYNEEQTEAIRKAAASKIMILTGGPGTGKTAALRGIMEVFHMFGLKVLLAAPTGHAAKNMEKATGQEAKTIHRLLECRNLVSATFKYNENRQLPGNALIVDEVSMIDINLMNHLLKAMPLGMRLILVGDSNQLPSVGPGNVLEDLMESGKFSVVELKHVFRQSEGSGIIRNAHLINSGKMPDLSEKGFTFIKCGKEEEAVHEIVELARKAHSQIQILSPVKKEVTGTIHLNEIMQENLNPNGQRMKNSDCIFRLGDKVMQIRNDYRKRVFNGETGYISYLDDVNDEILFKLCDRTVPYAIHELDELALAYAVTVHKSQGSEYPVVVMPLFLTYKQNLYRKLLYTAVTRAKEEVILIGSEEALEYAVENRNTVKRNTRLKERICGETPDMDS